jgi:tetratricopeptide (TPR) repeat protein
MFALLFICYVLAAAGTLSPRRGSSPSYITGFYLGVTVVIWASFCRAFFRKPAPKRRFAAFVAIFAALFGGHINRAQNGAQDARDANMPAVQEPVASRDTDGSTNQIPQEDCLAFALAFERAIQSGDVEAANPLVDWDAIAHAATAGLGIPPQTRAEFGRGVTDSLRSGDKGLFAAISGQVTAGGSYRFLRVREIDGHPTVLFRLINESGLNYHEFLLQKQAGKLRAVDLLIHLSGEKLSATLRRTATPLAQQWTKPLLQRLTTAVPEYVRHFDKFGTLSAAVREKRHDEALEIYGSMPEALRQDKAVLLMRHQAAMKTSEEELLRSIEDFRQYYPEDACLDFLLIDYYTLRGEYDQSIASIDRVDASVGGDPYLNTNRSDILYAKGEAAKAFALAEKAVADCPDLLDAHWTLLGLALLENDHERTLSTLTRIEQQFQLDLSGVDGSPEYEAFMQSSQGEKWARSHWQSTAGEKQ